MFLSNRRAEQSLGKMNPPKKNLGNLLYTIEPEFVGHFGRIPLRLTAAPLVGAVNVTRPQCRDDTIQTTQLIQSKGQLPGVARPQIIVEMIGIKNHYM